MDTHEIRYKGKLLGHFSEAGASEYVRRRFADKVAAEALDEDDWTTGRRKPFELSSKGNLLDTFDTDEQAHAALDEHAAAFAKASGRALIDVEGFYAVHEAPPMVAPPPPPPEPTSRDRRPTSRRE